MILKNYFIKPTKVNVNQFLNLNMSGYIVWSCGTELSEETQLKLKIMV